MSRQSSKIDYRDSHKASSTAERYYERVYAEGSADDTIWTVERRYLEDVITRLVGRRKRYLDFACGTGRILGFLSPRFETACGVDISRAMLDLARDANPGVELKCGDITTNKDLTGSDYDLITVFRFFLNAQPSLRDEVIKILAERLSGQGIMIFNVHNSRPSFLWVQNYVTGLFTGRRKPSLSYNEAADLAARANLEIVETYKTGVLPKCLHLLLRKKFWLALDGLLCRPQFLRKFASHVIYVCRYIKQDSAKDSDGDYCGSAE